MQNRITLKELPRIPGLSREQSVEIAGLRSDVESGVGAYCIVVLWGDELVPQVFHTNILSDFDGLFESEKMRGRIVGVYTNAQTVSGKVELLRTIFNDIAFCMEGVK